MGGEQLFGEAFALAPRGEQVLARFVTFADADMQLGGEALERFARAADLRARSLCFLGGGGHPGFLLAQLAGKPGDLRQGPVALGLEKLDVRAEGAQLGAALVQVGGEAGGVRALLAGFFRGQSESGERGVQVGLQARIRFGSPGEVRGELAREIGDLGDRRPGGAAGHAPGQRGLGRGFAGDARDGHRDRGRDRRRGGWLGFARRRDVRDRRGRDALRCRHLLRFGDLLVQSLAQADARADFRDVFFEAALHALSTALSRTGAPTRACTSSSTAWMSCAPLLSAS